MNGFFRGGGGVVVRRSGKLAGGGRSPLDRLLCVTIPGKRRVYIRAFSLLIRKSDVNEKKICMGVLPEGTKSLFDLLPKACLYSQTPVLHLILPFKTLFHSLNFCFVILFHRQDSWRSQPLVGNIAAIKV